MERPGPSDPAWWPDIDVVTERVPLDREVRRRLGLPPRAKPRRGATADPPLPRPRSTWPVAVVDLLALFPGGRFAPFRPRKPEPMGLAVVGFRADEAAIIAALSAGVPCWCLDYLEEGALADLLGLGRPAGQCCCALVRLAADRVARLTAEAPTMRGLTCREEQVVRLVEEGMCNKEIARRLRIAEKTVKNHLTHAYEKTGLRSRYEAIARARRSL